MSDAKLLEHGTTEANDSSGDAKLPPYPGPPLEEVPQPQPTVITGQVNAVIIDSRPMGPKPTLTVCPSCHQQIETKVDSKATTKTHLFALLLCVIGFWPCVCIPYCVDSCRSADHYCPNCNAYIGSYKN